MHTGITQCLQPNIAALVQVNDINTLNIGNFRQLAQRLKDQVWLRLHCAHVVYFGACYITPGDSPYFSMNSLASIQEECLSTSDSVLVMGDLHARIPNLYAFQSVSNNISYETNPDKVSNSHGRDITSLCTDLNLLPINHMKVGTLQCKGGFTYRKSETWISQIDWALASHTLLSAIKAFDIVQMHPVPTNHAGIHTEIDISINSPAYILERANLLGTYRERCNPSVSKRPFHMAQIDAAKFLQNLPDVDTILMSNPAETTLCETLTESLYKACSNATQIKANRRNRCYAKNASERWNILMQKGSDKELWNAINWSGNVEQPPDCKDRPSDRDFKDHFEQLLNPGGMISVLAIPDTNMYLPLLDDHIMPDEVDRQIKRLKSNKAAGADGVPPGVFKLLSDDWVIAITHLCNMVFEGQYPVQWRLAKLFTIFKKGYSLDTNNYRGISILAALAKIYDGVLNHRFCQWFTPDEEQSGGQAGRGCQEQILILRLLIDYAQKTKQTLYILFVDYKKAYDKVNRNKLLHMLTEAGCGSKFLRAIGESLKDSMNVIGAEIFQSSEGVRQGGTTSCSLFTFYINRTIREVKQFGLDGFLGAIHTLLVMDDTLLLATSRAAMQRKFELLVDSALPLDMEFHPGKLKYLCVNADDHEPFSYKDIVVERTEKYIYVGTSIMNEVLAKQVTAHVSEKQKHIRKFSSFVSKNYDAPFQVKQKTWSAALYSCESWFTKDLRCIEQPLLRSLKELLGVRNQTCTDLVYLELGQPSIKAVIHDRQKSFLQKVMGRNSYPTSILKKVITLAKQANSKMGICINSLQEMINVDDCSKDLQARKVSVQDSDSSRRVSYCSLNQSLEKHSVYETPSVPEYARIAFSRIRL